MKIQHLTKKDYKTSAWSGGTTTELFLYPESGDYARRDFLFRISSATVDLAESDFTCLPGVQRYITPLQGAFTLTHPGMAPVHLTPQAPPYGFPGDIPTHCVGTATDFNLMLKGCRGHMELCHSRAPIKPGFNGFYPTEKAVLTLDGQAYPMNPGDLLVVFAEKATAISLSNAPTLVCWVDA